MISILRQYKNQLKRHSIDLKIDSNFVNIVKIFYRESKVSQSIEWMFLFSIDFKSIANVLKVYLKPIRKQLSKRLYEMREK